MNTVPFYITITTQNLYLKLSLDKMTAAKFIFASLKNLP